MKKVANILFENQDQYNDFEKNDTVDSIFNLTTNESDLIIDVPTLFIGYKITKNKFNDINILVKKIDIKNYWTFNKQEKMVDYFNVMLWFKDHYLEYYINHYKYISYNRHFFKEGNLVDYIKSKNIYSIYINDRSIYFYFDNNILGIDKYYLMYMDMPLYKKVINLDVCENKYIDKNNELLNFYKGKNNYYSDIIEKYIGLWV